MKTVQVDKVGNRIHAKITYDNGVGPEEAKTITGASWNKPRKVWTYPLDLHTCRLLRRTFGARLRIGVALAEWARKEIEAEQAQLTLRTATDAALDATPLVAPRLAAALDDRPFQKVGARWVADGAGVIIGDEPGLGKTLQILSGLIESNAKRILVFCKKKAVRLVWETEINYRIGAEQAVAWPVVGTKAQRQKVLQEFASTAHYDHDKMHFVIGNIEMVRTKRFFVSCPIGCDDDTHCPKSRSHKYDFETAFPELFQQRWDAIVVDESHKALIGKNVMSKSITQTRLGMMRLPRTENGKKIAASGTPWRGKPEHFWGTLNWLAPDVFTSYWRFIDQYFETEEGYGGSKIIGGLREDRLTDFDRLTGRYMLRRTKAEVAKDLPPKQYGGTPLDHNDPSSTVGVWLDMDATQARAYKTIRDQGLLEFDGGARILLNGVLPELMRRKQYAVCNWDLTDEGELVPALPSPKLDWLVEFVEDRRDTGQKVVVASQFTKVINAFHGWLADNGIESYVLTGQTTERQADDRVKQFNDPDDKVPVMLINTMAGGESINLDACADDLVFLDETYIPDDQEQVENRIHRLSRMHQVNIWYLRTLGTIDESICRITGAREAIAKGRLDGARGQEIGRKLLWEDFLEAAENVQGQRKRIGEIS